MTAVEAIIAQAEESGDSNTVAPAARLEGFRRIHQAAQQAAELPPVMQAVLAL
ncbi:MAG: hypothetical protein HZY76_14625 [Anaerolineae bacterium]|nr:MAG: hypothetical protein HZY76_14625 [Anaerolineae bacterium]